MAELTAGDDDYTMQFSYKENEDLRKEAEEREMIACCCARHQPAYQYPKSNGAPRDSPLKNLLFTPYSF